jgi:hypothetical protein
MWSRERLRVVGRRRTRVEEKQLGGAALMAAGWSSVRGRGAGAHTRDDRCPFIGVLHGVCNVMRDKEGVWPSRGGARRRPEA